MATAKFDKAVLTNINADLKAAIAAVSAKYGIDLSSGNVNFSDYQFTTKVTGKIIGGVSDDKAKAEWELYAPFYGLKTEWFGMTFKDGQLTMKVVGINTRSPKNMIKIECVETGKGFKCNDGYIKSKCGK